MNNAIIHPSAKIGKNVTIGSGTNVGASAVVGDNCTIGDFCSIAVEAGGPWKGQPLRIGDGSVIRSHTVLYEGSELGADTQTGHHVLIREGTRAGRNLRIGSYSDIEGDCVIGDCARFHGYAHIGRGSRIGSFVHLYSLSILLNDPLPPSEVMEPSVLEDGVVITVGATVMPGSHMAVGSLATSRSVVSGAVPAGAVVEGPEGRIATHVTFLANFQHGIRHPWTRNFSKRYPAWAQARLAALEKVIVESRSIFVKNHQSN